jgi:hypothetical protein
MLGMTENGIHPVRVELIDTPTISQNEGETNRVLMQDDGLNVEAWKARSIEHGVRTPVSQIVLRVLRRDRFVNPRTTALTILTVFFRTSQTSVAPLKNSRRSLESNPIDSNGDNSSRPESSPVKLILVWKGGHSPEPGSPSPRRRAGPGIERKKNPGYFLAIWA